MPNDLKLNKKEAQTILDFIEWASNVTGYSYPDPQAKALTKIKRRLAEFTQDSEVLWLLNNGGK